MKGLWLSNYERAIQFYRMAIRNNRNLIKLSELDENTEPKITITPREVNTDKLKPYQEMIEYIDAIAYGKRISLDEKIYELEEIKTEREKGYKSGKSQLDEKTFTETDRFLERAIHDLKTVKNERIPVSAGKISISMVRGEISIQQALNDVRAKLTEIDFAIEDQIIIDFVEKGKNSIDTITQYLMGNTSPWHFYKCKDAGGELSAIIEAAGYTTTEVINLCKLEESISLQIAKAEEGRKNAKTPAPYRQLPEISAWMRSNPQTEHMTNKEFCEKFTTSDGKEINPDSLKTAWSGQGGYGQGGQDIKRRWDEEKRKQETKDAKK